MSEDKFSPQKVSTMRRHPHSRLARMLDDADPEFKVVNSQLSIWEVDESPYQMKLRLMDCCMRLNFTSSALFQIFYAKSKALELRFVVQDAQSFFGVFSSKCTTFDALASRISVFIEQPTNLTQNLMERLPVHRPSHHDLVFQCGADCSDGKQLSARWGEKM